MSMISYYGFLILIVMLVGLSAAATVHTVIMMFKDFDEE